MCGEAVALALFDTESDHTYDNECLISRVGPELVGLWNLSFASFGSDKITAAETKNQYNLTLMAKS